MIESRVGSTLRSANRTLHSHPSRHPRRTLRELTASGARRDFSPRRFNDLRGAFPMSLRHSIISAPSALTSSTLATIKESLGGSESPETTPSQAGLATRQAPRGRAPTACLISSIVADRRRYRSSHIRTARSASSGARSPEVRSRAGCPEAGGAGEDVSARIPLARANRSICSRELPQIPVDAPWTTRDGATLLERRRKGGARDVTAKLARRTTSTEWKAPQAVAQRATPEPPLPSAERATVDSAGYTSGLNPPLVLRTDPEARAHTSAARTLPSMRIDTGRINNNHPSPSLDRLKLTLSRVCEVSFLRKVISRGRARWSDRP